MRSLFTVLVFSSSFALTAAAATCPGKVQFQDLFTTVNPSWNMVPGDSSKATLQNGKFVVNFLIPDDLRFEIYGADVYDDVNVCVTVKGADADKPEDQAAGLIFWAKDASSYYTFEINANGNFCVHRIVAGRWIFPIPWLANPANAAIKKGAGPNSLRVQTRGETATLFVNDQQVSTLQGHPADGGSQVGFYAEGSSHSLNTWEFSDFTVAKP